MRSDGWGRGLRSEGLTCDPHMLNAVTLLSLPVRLLLLKHAFLTYTSLCTNTSHNYLIVKHINPKNNVHISYISRVVLLHIRMTVFTLVTNHVSSAQVGKSIPSMF